MSGQPGRTMTGCCKRTTRSHESRVIEERQGPGSSIYRLFVLYGRVEGESPLGRPRKRWLDVVGEDCRLFGITLQESDQFARNPGVV